MGKLVQEAGLQHEESYREKLAIDGTLVEISSDGSLADRAKSTIAAMESGASAIFQAAFLQAPWHGFADFLIRVEEASDLGGWSYEPVDTKLARSAKANHIVQLGLYAQMIGEIQGRMPRRVHVELGDGRRESFRLVDFGKVLSVAIARYTDFVEAGAKDTTAEPCSSLIKDSPPKVFENIMQKVISCNYLIDNLALIIVMSYPQGTVERAKRERNAHKLPRSFAILKNALAL
jgi:uncharacterized protein